MAYKKKILDGRSKEARRISKIKKLIATDLNKAAVQILERDISYLVVYAESLVKKDMSAQTVKSLPNFLKIHAALKSALAALDKLKPGKAESKSLADLFAEDNDH